MQPQLREPRLDWHLVIDVMADLPDHWREVLWRTVLLDEPLAAVGASMGLQPDAAAALAFQAHAGLCKAYRRRVEIRVTREA